MIHDRSNRYHAKYTRRPLEQCKLRTIICWLDSNIYNAIPSIPEFSAYSSAPAGLQRPRGGMRGRLRGEEGDYERDYSC